MKWERMTEEWKNTGGEGMYILSNVPSNRFDTRVYLEGVRPYCHKNFKYIIR